MQRKAGADGILLHTTFAPYFRFGEIEYSRTDSSGKKVLNKEQYENEIRIGKEVKRQQALSLADIEGRIIDESGNIDPEKLKEFFNELQAQGVQIMTGKNAEALLKKHNANALYLPGDTPGQPGMIVLREGADKQHIIEEIFHLKQHEQEGFRTLGASEIIDMELEAHDQMLEYARTKGWTKEEIEQLERNKAAWESDKKKYSSDVEFRKKFDAEFGGFKNRDDVEISISLRSKIGDHHASVVNNWFSNKRINYSGTDGTQNLSGNIANQSILNDIEVAIGNKRVLGVISDSQGRLSIILESDGVTYDMITIQTNVTGMHKLDTYNRAYNQNANTNIDVGTSTNKLVPDYTKNMANQPSVEYLYPQHLLPEGKSPVVKFKMTGKRKGTNGDFHEANKAAGIEEQFGTLPPPDYTWHHLDDFQIDSNGDAWCTMQLVLSEAHTKVPGMAHAGSVAQWKKYYIASNNSPGNFFYTQ